MNKTLLASILFFSLLPLSHTVYSAPPDFSLCDGLSGVARGLCRAGIAAGCADGTGNAMACMSIEENFVDATGELPPWLTPGVDCPCDYSTVPQTAVAWSDGAGNPKVIVLSCDSTEAALQAVNPTPQLPVVNAIVTTEVPPQLICQAVPQSGAGHVVGELTTEELAACRGEVLAYAADFLATFPTWPWVDNCSTP